MAGFRDLVCLEFTYVMCTVILHFLRNFLTAFGWRVADRSQNVSGPGYAITRDERAFANVVAVVASASPEISPPLLSVALPSPSFPPSAWSQGFTSLSRCFRRIPPLRFPSPSTSARGSGKALFPQSAAPRSFFRLPPGNSQTRSTRRSLVGHLTFIQVSSKLESSLRPIESTATSQKWQLHRWTTRTPTAIALTVCSRFHPVFLIIGCSRRRLRLPSPFALSSSINRLCR